MQENKKCCNHDHECNHNHDHCDHDHCDHEHCNHNHDNCENHGHCGHHCHRHIVVCPVCNKGAISVPTVTVQTLTQMKEIGEDFYLCTNPHCNTVYFNKEFIFNKCDITTKVWYKGTMEEFIVCYCHNITLIDIINAVKALDGNTNKDDVLRYLGKSIEEKDCLHKNPTGTSCDKLLDNAIEFAYEVYIKNKKES